VNYFLGVILALVAVYTTIVLMGASPLEYLDLHAFVIVVLGSIFGTAAGSNFIHLFKMPMYMLKAMLPLHTKAEILVVDIKRMADKTRQNGLPALTSEIPTAPDEFSRRGLKLLVAGADSALVETILKADIHATEERHNEAAGFMDAVGGNAPTFGLIGTVMGTVESLGSLDDISALGHALSVALLATLYGVFSANVVWLPLAGQLRNKSHKEMALRRMYMDGLLAIQSGLSSDMVDKLMKSHVSQSLRAKIEGGKVGGKKTDRHIEYTTYMSPLDQERALAFMAEIKRETEAKNLGQDDVKTMLAELINENDDKMLAKEFATEYMKLKTVNKLPKGSKRKGKKKRAAGGAPKRRLADD
jgi:chemotaxis protein MotA